MGIAPLLAFVLASACGYIGGPVPPLVNIPSRVTDLAAVQRGGRIIVQFTVPVKTTEGEPLQPPVKLDLRVFDQHPAPKAIQGGIALYEIPCAEWAGKTVVIEVRAIGSNGKESAWSNITLPVVAPPPMPQEVRAEPTASGVRVTWQSPGSHFRVLRAGDARDAAYALLAPDVTAHEWTDTITEFGKTYRYLVQGFEPLAGGRSAESDLPDAVSVTPEAPLPVAPVNLRAVAALTSIELSWDVPEGTPVVGFRIYRAEGDRELARIGEIPGVPSYSDKTAEPGKTYRYAVSAIDANGREGPKSAAVEASR